MSVQQRVVVESVRRVWIETGCIRCGWCTDLLPEVFTVVPGKSCVINGQARKDGCSDANRRNPSDLRKQLRGAEADFIQFIADGCPPKVIQLSE